MVKSSLLGKPKPKLRKCLRCDTFLSTTELKYSKLFKGFVCKNRGICTKIARGKGLWNQ